MSGAHAVAPGSYLPVLATAARCRGRVVIGGVAAGVFHAVLSAAVEAADAEAAMMAGVHADDATAAAAVARADRASEELALAVDAARRAGVL